MLIIELMLILTTFFPIYHLITAFKKYRIKEISSKHEHGFSILIPCYNESVCINKTIESVKKLQYSNYEVIFINDGSNDNTFNIINKNLHLHSFKKVHALNYYRSKAYENFYCIDKPNTGKAYSLNMGIAFSSNDIIITLDADSILSPNCLNILNDAFCDENVAAAGGAIHIMQAKDTSYLKRQSFIKKLIIKVQSIDYLKGFFIYKLSLARQDALAIISGAFGAFRKSVVQKVGGFRKSLGEDIDITLKIQKYIANTNQKIVYLPEAVCFTECPESIEDLYKQRIRWQKGFMDCILYHSKFLLFTCFKNPLSFFLIIESICIGVFSCLLPCLTTVSLIISGSFVQGLYILSFLAAVNIIYSLCAYIICGKYYYPYTKRYLLSIIADIFLLKPFLAFVYLMGTVQYLANKSDWEKTKRSTMLSKY